MIKRLLEDLSQVLNAELSQYRRLLQLSCQEQEFIVTCQIDELMDITRVQETLALELKMLEEARLILVSKLSMTLEILPEELTLTRLIELVEEPYATDYAAFRQEAISLVRELQNVNSQNAYLIGRSVEYISGELKIFSALSPSQTYLNTGEVSYNSRSELQTIDIRQ